MLPSWGAAGAPDGLPMIAIDDQALMTGNGLDHSGGN